MLFKSDAGWLPKDVTLPFPLLLRYTLISTLDLIPTGLYGASKEWLGHHLIACDQNHQKVREELITSFVERSSAIKQHVAFSNRNLMLQTAFEKG